MSFRNLNTSFPFKKEALQHPVSLFGSLPVTCFMGGHSGSSGSLAFFCTSRKWSHTVRMLVCLASVINIPFVRFACVVYNCGSFIVTVSCSVVVYNTVYILGPAADVGTSIWVASS